MLVVAWDRSNADRNNMNGSGAGGGQPFPAPTRTPRVRLRPRQSARIAVDGAWWPRTDNLTAELHDLVAAVTPRLGHVARVAYDWNALSIAQDAIDAPDGIDISGPEPGQADGVLRLISVGGARMSLSVIAPGSESEAAEEGIRAAVDS